MKVGLLDVDGHNFPNVPLMKLSAYHKRRGDAVEMWVSLSHYDIVYKSKVFSFTPDITTPIYADHVMGETKQKWRRLLLWVRTLYTG